ncbi:MAG: hypothetical protein QM535_04335 [Limnohabitans sp.]|nr:hypothetical protein [Limnohabitans sp.]
MKNVLIKNSFLFFLFTIFLGCHKPIKKTDESIKEIVIKDKKNVQTIVTNSLDSNFIYDLIETQKVDKRDTILFREWETMNLKPVLIDHNNTKFTVLLDSIVRFYKTGDIKFSKHKITILDKKNDKSFYVQGIAISNDFREPYSIEQTSPAPSKINRISQTEAQFQFDCHSEYQLYVNFKIKDNILQITKLTSSKYFKKGIEKQKLDTIIVLQNKSYIYPDSLLYKLNKSKKILQKKK